MKGKKNGKRKLTKDQRRKLLKAMAAALRENGLSILMSLLYLILAISRCL